ARDVSTRSVFNSKRTMPDALRRVVREVSARLLVLSYNDESWVTLAEVRDICAARGAVEVLAFDSRRYVGAQIGIHNPKGERVGTVSHVRNREYLLVAGERADVERIARAARTAVPHG